MPLVLHYWGIARRHMWLILGFVAAALVLGAIVTLLTTPQYTAQARIEIQRQQANVTNVEGLEPEQTGQNLEFYQTQYSLLKARSLADRVSRNLRLARDVEFLDAHGIDHGSSLLSPNSKSNLNPSELRAREVAVVNALLEAIEITPVRGSALVDVSYTSASPSISAKISNVWIDEFVRQNIDRRFASTSDARQFLETRLADLRDRLEKSERDLVNYAEAQGIVRLAETQSSDGRTSTAQTLVGSNLDSLNRELVAATAQRVAAEGHRDAARLSRSNSDTISNSAVNQLRQRRAEMSAEYAQMMEQFEPAYPPARALQQQIAALDRSIIEEERRVLDAGSAAYDAALYRENMLKSKVQELLGKLDRQNRATIQYNIYQREVDTNRELYNGLLQRYKEIGVAGVGVNNVAVVDAATIPSVPSSPNLMINLAIALIIGLASAIAAVLVLENLDEGIRQPQQVVEKLGVPLLGTTPHIEGEEPREVVRDPKSIISEAYMTVRTNLSFATDHGVPRAFSVTSSAPAEGKSTTSFALALMLSRVGKKVLLVDIDLRLPALAKALRLSNEHGMSNYLSGSDNWRAMVQATDLPNLSFLGSGPVPPSAPELLSSGRLSAFIEDALQHYDHVVFDSAPMLGLSDAALVGRAVEGVVFAIEYNRVPIRSLTSSLEWLHDAQIRVFGAVVTKYKSEKSGYGYGYDYVYQYEYGNGSSRES